jgi:hypothetical protein
MATDGLWDMLEFAPGAIKKRRENGNNNLRAEAQAPYEPFSGTSGKEWVESSERGEQQSKMTASL